MKKEKKMRQNRAIAASVVKVGGQLLEQLRSMRNNGGTS